MAPYPWSPSALTEVKITAVYGGRGVDHARAQKLLERVGLGDRPWTPAHKKAVLDSRVEGIDADGVGRAIIVEVRFGHRGEAELIEPEMFMGKYGAAGFKAFCSASFVPAG